MKEGKIKSVKYNFIMNFILTATQFIFPLITFPYVSRVLGAAALGKVSFASSVANYFMMVASLGIPTYGIRACAQVRDDKDKLSRTVKEIFIINTSATALAVIAYVISIYMVPKFADNRMLFVINGLNIMLNMFGMNWLFRALEQYDYITIRSILFKVISVVLMFLLVRQQQDYVLYGAITVFAAVGSYALNFVRVKKIINTKVCGPYQLKRHIKPIFILFAQSLAVSIYTNLDVVMLGFLKTDIDVGYYNAAIKIKTILLSLVTSLANVLLPRMSYYAKHKMHKEFFSMMLKTLNLTALMAIPLSMYFVLFGKESILLLAGNGYLGAVLAMQIITIAVIPNGLTGVLGVQVLTALEKEKYVLYSVVIGAIVDFGLNLIMIPKYGAAGAAGATMIAEFMVLLVQVICARDLLHDIKGNLRFIRYMILSILASLVSCRVKLFDIESSLVVLLLSAMVFFGAYGIGLLIIKEETIVELVDIILIKLKLKKGSNE